MMFTCSYLITRYLRNETYLIIIFTFGFKSGFFKTETHRSPIRSWLNSKEGAETFYLDRKSFDLLANHCSIKGNVKKITLKNFTLQKSTSKKLDKNFCNEFIYQLSLYSKSKDAKDFFSYVKKYLAKDLQNRGVDVVISRKILLVTQLLGNPEFLRTHKRFFATLG